MCKFEAETLKISNGPEQPRLDRKVREGFRYPPDAAKQEGQGKQGPQPSSCQARLREEQRRVEARLLRAITGVETFDMTSGS